MSYRSGHTVVVFSYADFERLLSHPDSVRGEWDGAAGRGVVWFPGNDEATRARRELFT